MLLNYIKILEKNQQLKIHKNIYKYIHIQFKYIKHILNTTQKHSVLHFVSGFNTACQGTGDQNFCVS